MEHDPASLWGILAVTAPAKFVKTSVWAYPALETVHMIGLGLLFGGIFLLDLRLLGAARTLPLPAFSRFVLPWVWVGFAINFTSGALLFLSDAAAFATNLSFRIKMALILIAGLNAAWFHLRIFQASTSSLVDTTPWLAKRAAAFSIVLWLSVIAAGRMIAYWE